MPHHLGRHPQGDDLELLPWECRRGPVPVCELLQPLSAGGSRANRNRNRPLWKKLIHSRRAGPELPARGRGSGKNLMGGVPTPPAKGSCPRGRALAGTARRIGLVGCADQSEKACGLNGFGSPTKQQPTSENWPYIAGARGPNYPQDQCAGLPPDMSCSPAGCDRDSTTPFQV
ncbi:hypothetical protein PS639_03177 [Pseudomonas fluorescens]|nr:hypothetical protein PS639_03177 [Pseudomonas fluorescens]